MIRVVAVPTHPGRREELLAAFPANVPVPNVHAEKNCVEYEYAGHINRVRGRAGKRGK